VDVDVDSESHKLMDACVDAVIDLEVVDLEAWDFTEVSLQSGDTETPL
jgi:hypothetical protein